MSAEKMTGGSIVRSWLGWGSRCADCPWSTDGDDYAARSIAVRFLESHRKRRHSNVSTDLTGTSDMQNLGPKLDKDTWLQGICDSLNITPEQLAALSKVVRLVPRNPPIPKGQHDTIRQTTDDQPSRTQSRSCSLDHLPLDATGASAH